MRSPSILRNRLAIVVVSAMVGAVVAGGVVLATDGNTIHACAEKRTGQLRVVDDPSDCNPAEESLDWGIVGPVGAQGPQGPAGPAGPQGPPGPIATYRNSTSQFTVQPNTQIGTSVGCDGLDPVLSGGYEVVAGDPLVVTANLPADPAVFFSPQRWAVSVLNTGGVAGRVTFYVLCADVS